MRFVSLVILGLIFVIGVTVAFAFLHPASPLPSAWHLNKPLVITDKLTPVTAFKFRRALETGESCRAVLETGADFVALPDFEASDQCHIRDRVELRGVANVSLRPLETRCQTALRLAMWTEHGIKPASRRHFEQDIVSVQHAASYNCRSIRNMSGRATGMSTHATAESVDIVGVRLADGRDLRLIDGWTATDARSTFFRDMRNSACLWFRVTLGPEYNRLHADHFHLQHTGWGLCR